ncbi:MAG: translation initiation factor IF-3 [Rickettsiales bacterium]|nr:translation initiation factor IF-3 [Rickettsiales bacterium]
MANTALNINSRIRAREVRVIGPDGGNLGIMSVPEAMARARADGLDLIEISPSAVPPICKIADYGKFKYEESKRLAHQRKNQKVQETKELKVRPNIDAHDLETKMKSARKFVDEGNKVKFTCRFRGREMGNRSAGEALLSRIKADLGDRVKIEREPVMEGYQMQMVVSPAAAK